MTADMPIAVSPSLTELGTLTPSLRLKNRPGTRYARHKPKGLA